MDRILAHIYQTSLGEWKRQTLEEHSLGVAKLASRFAKKFGSGDWAWLIGKYHDLGKMLAAWQLYLLYTTGYTQDMPGEKGQHSLAGALLLTERLESCGALPLVRNTLAYPIVGHHSGLPNWTQPGSRRLSELLGQAAPSGIKIESLSSSFRALLEAPLPDSFPPMLKTGSTFALEGFALWGRMLFSCLIDADRLDSERFEKPERYAARGQYMGLDELSARLDTHLACKQAFSPQSEINLWRQRVLRDCQQAALSEPGIFTLTVPTGGGKTLSGMSFALRHALQWGKERVIFAIPFTSIIEQNASVYKFGTTDPEEIAQGAELFGETNVIEHHSSFAMSEDDEERYLHHKLATENWDAPIIVTTNVQLFESLFAASCSQCRKLHNIVNSVIVLDEAQILPSKYLKPILTVLKDLVEHYGVTLVLSTATQPALSGEKIGSVVRNFSGLSNVREIISDRTELAQALQRVEVSFELNPSQKPDSWGDLAMRLCAAEQVLCVVNTRKDCRNLYAAMPQGTWHLSALMCPEDRTDRLFEIRKSLHAGKTTRVISTQLIEAGVDIDFPVVYRAESGLDSVAQSAGRCNREGHLERGEVVVFQAPQGTPKLRGDLRSAADATRTLIDSSGFDFSDPLEFVRYFRRFYADREDFGEEEYGFCFERGERQGAFEYRRYARHFNFIEPQKTVIVRYKGRASMVDSSELIDLLNNTWNEGIDYQVLRKLQRFSVTIREKDYQQLVKQRLIEDKEGIGIQIEPNLYIPGLGLDMECVHSAVIV
jgi:CRISPR-associated endonuclease/helicase Cas3